MGLEKYDGFVFGGGAVKSESVDGQVYVNLADILNVLLQTSIGLGLEYSLNQREEIRISGATMVDITALMRNLHEDLKVKHGVDK